MPISDVNSRIGKSAQSRDGVHFRHGYIPGMRFLLIGQGFDPWRWAFGSQGASEGGRCDARRHVQNPCWCQEAKGKD